jgi:hypothetical protein
VENGSSQFSIPGRFKQLKHKVKKQNISCHSNHGVTAKRYSFLAGNSLNYAQS